MSRFRFWFAAPVVAALFSITVAASARQPEAAESVDLTGKFELSNGGYLVLSTDDLGRVEGFFERDGHFGRVTGRVAGNAVSAVWVQNEGPKACETAVDGSPYWGKLALNHDADGAVEIAWGACEASPRVD